MPSIIECAECGYSRSSDQDGRQFHEVCGICYLEDCLTPTTEVLLCEDCNNDPNIKQQVPIIDPGESLFT